jgi:hypothetical protein
LQTEHRLDETRNTSSRFKVSDICFDRSKQAGLIWATLLH